MNIKLFTSFDLYTALLRRYLRGSISFVIGEEYEEIYRFDYATKGNVLLVG